MANAFTYAADMVTAKTLELNRLLKELGKTAEQITAILVELKQESE